MFRFEKALKREERYNKHKRDNPSFSSSLLDQICRSIDDNDGIAAGDSKTEGFKFNRETMQKKQIKGSMERKVFEQANVDKTQVFKEFKRTSHHHDRNHDRILFSSSSSSSDTSSGGFSSSDTESMYGTKTKAPCLVPPPRPKPVRTSVSAPPQKPLFWEQRSFPMFDDHAPKSGASLKKVKQPISPGARIANFINSLFTTTGNNNPKKTKNPSSSVSRSRLSKNPPSTREELRDGAKRTVRFCPVSVNVEEDSKPCRQGSRLLPVSVPTAWKIGKSPSKKCDGEVKFQVMEKCKRVEEIAREFIKGYHQNQKNNSRYVVAKMDEEDDDDDAGSDSSSDLFELDHLVLMGDDKYREELPVYETTHVETNRAIADGFIV